MQSENEMENAKIFLSSRHQALPFKQPTKCGLSLRAIVLNQKMV